MLVEALKVVIILFLEHPLATAILVVVLEAPRYTFAIAALGIGKLLSSPSCAQNNMRVTAIVPTYNGGARLSDTLQSLVQQREPMHEILIIDDGSTDDTQSLVSAFAKRHANIKLIRHKQRAGKSAAVNHAAYLATGELLLIIDNDTTLASDGCKFLAAQFIDPDVAAASGNLLVSNKNRNALTALQSVEYMLAIPIGRGFLSYLNAMSCCSGAFSMFRTNAFRQVGGLNVGPGEDLEITLRLRQAGYSIRFSETAVAHTSVPQTFTDLIRQRLRWDGDAVAIRLFMYRELSFFKKSEPLPNALQRLDYIFLELLPTIIFPFYLCWLWLEFGAGFIDILIALYIVLFWLYGLNLLLAAIITKRALTWLDFIVLPIMPLYQGIVMRLVRFVAISDEIMLARSHHDTYVPDHVREALYGEKHRE